jgi:hypothetical protein
MKPALPRARQFKANWAKACDEHAAKSGESRRAFASNATEVLRAAGTAMGGGESPPKNPPPVAGKNGAISSDLQGFTMATCRAAVSTCLPPVSH